MNELMTGSALLTIPYSRVGVLLDTNITSNTLPYLSLWSSSGVPYVIGSDFIDASYICSSESGSGYNFNGVGQVFYAWHRF